ncbi:hypothetical protein [Acidovorax sp. PRC11]|uniref:hypothetical protein n=1 Tax=Acidovorax sp. PRC11 TaxID=2962592 RepID=UPI0028810C0A|nr:hypothetical protein [Acidovorax sp. PRC11]MDT0140184.1 hypothetical protein [Acidovorax sp. PRC11]
MSDFEDLELTYTAKRRVASATKIAELQLQEADRIAADAANVLGIERGKLTLALLAAISQNYAGHVPG